MLRSDGGGKHRWRVDALWLTLLCAASAPTLFLYLRARGFTDNEGMYAEIGREMLETRDWITPHLNGAVYLNKPPLLFWLTACLFRLVGFNESVRLIGGIATLGTALLIFAIALEIWPTRPASGLWAATAYLAGVLTPIEACFLRPDPLLTLFVCLSLWGAARISRRAGTGDAAGAAALWGGIALGVMSKGLLGLLLPAIALLPALAACGEVGRWRRYCPWWALALATAIALPWHALVGLRNPGFWWDYLINQHLLYFFDHKLPRDNTSDPLWLTWAAFGGRLFPWLFLLPAAIALQFRWAGRARTMGGWLPLSWLVSVCLFVSLSKGRQIHYMLPAVPAAALCIGLLCDEWAGVPLRSAAVGAWKTEKVRHGWIGRVAQGKSERAVPYLLTAAASAGMLLWAPAILRSAGMAADAPLLVPIASRGFVIAVLGSAAALLFALRGRLDRAPGFLAAAFFAFNWNAARAFDRAEAALSPRPIIRSLGSSLLQDSVVVYEAGQEYQLCGALDFYLHRRVWLLEPKEFVPPTYLQGHTGDLFIPRDLVRREWAEGRTRYLLFTDPERPVDSPADYPQPFYELRRGAYRLLLTNLPIVK